MVSTRTLFAAAALLLAALPASARIVDLSAASSGKSRYVFNHDGKPVDIGPSKPKTPKAATPQAALPPPAGEAAKAEPKGEQRPSERDSRMRAGRGVALTDGRTEGARRVEPRPMRIRLRRR